jgi:hypothetical protein
MRFSTFFSTAVLALTANAFLVPNTADTKSGLGPQDLVAVAEIKAMGQLSIDLECPKCPKITTNNAGQFIKHDRLGETYTMNFSNDKNQLLLNGVPIYPPSLQALSKTMTVHQKGARYSQPLDLPVSYSLEQVGSQKVGEMTSVVLNIQLLQIGNNMVDIPSVTVGLIQESTGEASLLPPYNYRRVLILSQIFVHTVKITKSTLTEEAKKCRNMLCRIRALIKAKLQALRNMALKKLPSSFTKTCGGLLGHKATEQHHGPPKTHGGIPKFIGKFPPKQGHQEGGKHHHHHHHHSHHSKLARIAHRFARVFRTIILPVLVGISAGMALGAISMAFIHAIYAIRARCTRGYQRIQIVDVEVVEEGKNDDLPQYEELESRVETDEKKELLS